jgi:hypothetical protein
LFGVAWLANRAGGPRFAAQWIAAQLAVLALWAPWLLELRQQLKDFGGSFPFETATTADIVLAAGLLYSPLQTDFLGPNLLLAAGAVCAALWALRRRPKTIYLLAGLSFIPFLAQIALIPWSPSTFAMRSLLWTQIPLSVMAAAIVAGRGRLTSLLLSSAILVANAVVYYAYYGPRPGEDWRGVAQHIEQSAKPGELVLFTNSFDPLSFEHYFAGDHSALTIANLRSPYPPTRHELNFRLTEEHLAALPKIVAGHGRVWVLARLWKDYGALLAPALERLGRIEEIKQFRGQYLFVIQVSLAKDAAPTAAP